MTLVTVVEIPYRIPETDTEGVRYFGTRGFTTKPTDSPAGVEVESRLLGAVSMRRELFSDKGFTGGASAENIGPIRLRNTDKALDALRRYSVHGRVATVRQCEVTGRALPAYPSGWTTVLTARMRQPEIGGGEATIELRDRRMFATAAFQPHRYGGTNALTLDGIAGIDGIASDLRGKPIPVLLGAVFNIKPPCVNTSRLIYQVHDGAHWGPLRDVTAVYDNGQSIPMELGEDGARMDYFDQADMEANEPAEGTYRVWPAGGCFRLGSPPDELTCDAVRGFPPNDCAAHIHTVVDASADETDVPDADLTALRAANRATCGLWTGTEEITNGAVMNALTSSIGAWWALDETGQLRTARLEAPSGDPVFVATPANIKKGTLRALAINDEDVPYYRVTVRGARNYTKQDQGLAGGVGAARRARLAQEYQDAVAEDATVALDYSQPPALTVDTTLQCLPACQIEATRLLGLYNPGDGAKRERFDLTVLGTLAELAPIRFGSVIRIETPELELEAGKLCVVLGFRPGVGSKELTVWG